MTDELTRLRKENERYKAALERIIGPEFDPQDAAVKTELLMLNPPLHKAVHQIRMIARDALKRAALERTPYD